MNINARCIFKSIGVFLVIAVNGEKLISAQILMLKLNSAQIAGETFSRKKRKIMVQQ